MAVTASLATTNAHAHGYKLECLLCGTWMPVGVNVGGLSRWRNGENNGAFLIGGEASVLVINSNDTHWGGYVDTTYDGHDRGFRSSAGPELIILKSFPLGFDAGPLIEWKGAHSHVGVRARFFIPLLIFAPYIGTTALFLGEQSFAVEGGLLLKGPIPLDHH